MTSYEFIRDSIYPFFVCVLAFVLNYFFIKRKDKLPTLNRIVNISNKKDILKNKKIYKFTLKKTNNISSEEEKVEKYTCELEFEKIEKINIKEIKENMYGFYFREYDKVGFLFSQIEYVEYGKFRTDDKLIDLSKVLEDEDVFICNKEDMPRYFYCVIDNKAYSYELSGENQLVSYPKKCKIK